ncbi:MAG: FAD:protein FMN transferase [Verrucomicrobiales bacterium]|nr:FAD:protein FMN transferase [Verrucomicrobiales bacterium]
MPTVRLARHAMNTRFEVLLHGASEPALRAAGEEALDEIGRIEAQLSIFRPDSEMARVNRHAAEGPVRVSPPVFQLLERAQSLSRQTGGAFDPTVGPLVRAWGFLGGSGAWPDPARLAEARARVGMEHVELDAARFSVRFARPGMMLDLGAIGKGYALDVAVECLREAGVTCALLHGGTSSVQGLGVPPDGQPWKVALGPPAAAGDTATADDTAGEVLAEFVLTDASLGVSAVAGKAFRQGDREWGHVLDPRTGEPVQGALMAAVVLPEATATDALSTALLVLGAEGLEKLGASHPNLEGLVVLPELGPTGGRTVWRRLPPP